MDRKVQRESSEYIYELLHATSVALAADPLDAGILYSLHGISSDAAQSSTAPLHVVTPGGMVFSCNIKLSSSYISASQPLATIQSGSSLRTLLEK